MNIQAGMLFGKGTIAGAVQSSGKVTAGDSATKPGKLSISGSYSQNSTGALNISIGRTTAGTQYGQLAVSNGFVPAVGNTFTTLTGSPVSGTFGTVNGLSINSSELFTIKYNSTNVTLSVASGP
jgi:hypothetical protein